MIKLTKFRNIQQGFTVAELTIATAVFSVVILTAVAGFLQIGRLFYKGVTLTSTQETANQIYRDMSGYFQTASTVSPVLKTDPPPAYNYLCIGGARYTFNLNKEIDTSATPDHSAGSGNFGILKDILPGASACAPPCDDNPAASCPSGVRFQTPQELLGDKMRLLKMEVTPAAGVPDFYNVSMILAYGDDDVLAYSTPADPSTGYCISGAGGQYCSVIKVDGSLSQGYK